MTTNDSCGFAHVLSQMNRLFFKKLNIIVQLEEQNVNNKGLKNQPDNQFTL